jgi:3-hydroxyisobutyrate dehydrogenase-like beta-hydroxyacid dehydrogenase
MSLQLGIALIGFGEAGSTFAAAAGWGAGARAYDVAPDRRDAMRVVGVTACGSPAEALAGAELVLSLVTADQALEAARSMAPLLSPNAMWCDMNSVAPETKRAAAEMIESARASYVDVAVTAPVQPARLNVPLLLSGPAAGEAQRLLRTAGFANSRVVGADVGRASTIKMVRSVMVKGIEALTAEMVLAARRADVLDEVIASLDASETQMPWAERADYNVERMSTHGVRRAAEMEQVARTLKDLGVDPVMTRGTIVRQLEMAALAKQQEGQE